MLIWLQTRSSFIVNGVSPVCVLRHGQRHAPRLITFETLYIHMTNTCRWGACGLEFEEESDRSAHEKDCAVGKPGSPKVKPIKESVETT